MCGRLHFANFELSPTMNLSKIDVTKFKKDGKVVTFDALYISGQPIHRAKAADFL